MEEREVFKGGIEERTVSKEVKLFELIVSGKCQLTYQVFLVLSYNPFKGCLGMKLIKA